MRIQADSGAEFGTWKVKGHKGRLYGWASSGEGEGDVLGEGTLDEAVWAALQFWERQCL